MVTHTHMSVSVCLSVCLSVRLSVRPSVRLSLSVSVGLLLSVSVSPCLYVGRQIDRHVSMHTRTHYQWLTPNRIPKGAKWYILWPQSTYIGTTLRPMHILYEYMDPYGSPETILAPGRR